MAPHVTGRSWPETITRDAESDYTHKKSSPPSHFARVKLRLQPLTRGQGLEFANEVVGKTILPQWIASVERGVREAAKAGILNNGPVVDCRVTVYDGTYHDVDSNDEAFFIAAQKAFWQAMGKAGPELVKTPLRVAAIDGETIEE